MIKLRTKLTLIFILFSMVITLLISTISHYIIMDKFNYYLKSNIEKRVLDVHRSLFNVYENGSVDIKAIDNVGMFALDSGLIITIYDNDDTVVWDARTVNKVRCQNIEKSVISNLKKIDADAEVEFIVKSMQIMVGGISYGRVEIGYYGPIYYTNEDIFLLDTLKEILFSVGATALVISIIISIILSYSVSKPISSVIEATKFIAKGNYKSRVKGGNSVAEIRQMITSVNKLATDLEDQEKIRKTLTRDIAHELRTPLTTIQGQVEALIDKIWSPTEERLKSISQEILRLSRLVGTLENLSRYESEELILNKDKVQINELITTLIINFEKQILDKEISLKLNIEECIAVVDKDKISQAIVNILSNSIKYSLHRGTLWVGCIKDNQNVYISIKDNGIGISNNHLPYIFERFYRVDESRARATGGTGIGLTISKAIVEAHSGKIKVISEIDKGSEFIIILPVK